MRSLVYKEPDKMTINGDSHYEIRRREGQRGVVVTGEEEEEEE